MRLESSFILGCRWEVERVKEERALEYNKLVPANRLHELLPWLSLVLMAESRVRLVYMS